MLGIVLLALGLRTAYLLQARSNPLFDQPVLDARMHVEWARAIVNGESYLQLPYFRAPLYPWFLASIYWFGGSTYLAPRIIQILLGAVSTGLVYLLGREAFGLRVAILAGLGAATYGALIYYDCELLMESLSVFLNLLALWLLLRTRRVGGRVGWLLAGLVLGLSAINRPNVLLFIPVAAIWVALRRLHQWRSGVVDGALFLLAFMVPILPITVLNYVRGGDAVLISWQGGPNFYIGNNEYTDGKTARLPGARRDWWGLKEDVVYIAERSTGHSLKPSEVSRFYYKKALRFMRRSPAHAAGLMWQKFQYFWNDLEVPSVSNMYFFTARYAPFVRWLPLRFGIVAPLAVLGFWYSRQQMGRSLPLLVFTLLYVASVIVFFVNCRFRIPVLPLFIIYAAVGASHLWMLATRRDWHRLIVGCAAFALLYVFMNPGIPQAYIDAPGARCTVARALMIKGMLSEAYDECADVIRIDPNYPSAYITQGLICGKRGDIACAEERFRKALEVDPAAPVHEFLVEMYVTQERYRDAMRALREGVAISPGNAALQVRLARMLACCPDGSVRNGREAVEVAQTILNTYGPAAEGLDALAAAYAESRRFDEALDAAQKALRMATEQHDADLAAQIEGRIALYKRRQPCRELSESRKD
ncbi:MAG: glycosyltransferase family 39 protein [Phycisphaerales bacterium]|nr:glycosyltransferase family 39 protein [Phycisphaerales bacterium]